MNVVKFKYQFLFIITALYSLGTGDALANTARRSVADNRIFLHVIPDGGTFLYAIEESIPVGLTPENISDSGTWDSVQRKLKWGPYTDDLQRTLQYEVTGASGAYTMDGEAGFGVSSVTTSGDQSILLGGSGASNLISRTISGLTVSLNITPDASNSGYAVEEYVPDNLTPININDNGVWDSVNQMIKWGPFFGPTPRVLSYDITGPDGSHAVSGLGSFDGQGTLISGDVALLIGGTPFESWAQTMFGSDWSNNSIAGEAVDYDLDGFNNMQEYIAGTIPTDSNSYFRITNFDQTSPTGSYVVEWLSVSGRTYSIYWSTNLTGSSILLDTNLDFPQNSYTDTTHNAESSGFYDVDVKLK